MRTDATRFCPHCVVRFGRYARCPQCDAEPLALDKPAGRRAALRQLMRSAKRASPTSASASASAAGLPLDLATYWWRRAFLPVCGVAAAVSFVDGGTWGDLVIGFGVAFLAQIALLALLITSYFTYTWIGSVLDGRRGNERAPATAATLLLLSAKTKSGGNPDAEILAGQVRAETLLRSPLAHSECVAYRIVGRGPMGPIDEGAGCAFQLELDGGAMLRVETNPSSIDVVVSGEARALRPDAELSHFLEVRGVFPERGPLHLAEGVIRDGDRVVVEGAVVDARADEGYRSRRVERTLRETERTALTIRRLRTEETP